MVFAQLDVLPSAVGECLCSYMWLNASVCMERERKRVWEELIKTGRRMERR